MSKNNYCNFCGRNIAKKLYFDKLYCKKCWSTRRKFYLKIRSMYEKINNGENLNLVLKNSKLYKNEILKLKDINIVNIRIKKIIDDIIKYDFIKNKIMVDFMRIISKLIY